MPSPQKSSPGSSPSKFRRRKIRARTSAKQAKKLVKRTLEIESRSGPSGAVSPRKSQSNNSALDAGCCDAGECAQVDCCCLGMAPECWSPHENPSPVDPSTPITAGVTDTSPMVSRWLHITAGEHVCVPCRDEFAKPGRQLHEHYTHWRRRWCDYSRTEPNYRAYVLEELLPYYSCCGKCGQWRRATQVRRPIQPLATWTHKSGFTCADAADMDAQWEAHPCQRPPDKHASAVISDPIAWMTSVRTPLLLQQSPALFFLHDYYYNDEVGMSPVNGLWCDDTRDCSLDEISQPFVLPDEEPRALCLRADVLEHDELLAFPEYSIDQSTYLGLRNLVVALWHLAPSHWLPAEKCVARVRCAGLLGVLCALEVVRVWRFMAVRGCINVGLVKPPAMNVKCESVGDSKSINDAVLPESLLSTSPRKTHRSVIIIGGGIAGLCCARQLVNLTNGRADVLVLEAEPVLGGRLRDDWSLGAAVGCGAQLVTGVVNNPICMMCYQSGIRYRPLTDKCPLLDAKVGGIADSVADQRIDFHFNCLLDAVSEWRTQLANEGVQAEKFDSNLQEQMDQMHKLFTTQANMKWTEVEERCLHWQLGNIEFSCGAPLRLVSARHWDQNEAFAQFAGDHALLVDGARRLVNSLAQGIDVRLAQPVKTVDYTNPRRIGVVCGKTRYTCDKLVVAVPLAVLQQDSIHFAPLLPSEKRTAISRLGAGIIEKVAVRFERNFWSAHIAGADYFGRVPKSREDRGLFNMFYDLSRKPECYGPDAESPDTEKRPKLENESASGSGAAHVLMSYVCGDSVKLVNKLTDEQLKDMFVQALHELFPQEEMGSALGVLVTRWRVDPHFGMSYSYVRQGATGNTYDSLGSSVDGRIYFAGEGTNRHFPQTMTGAYLSGLHAAASLITGLMPDAAVSPAK